MQSLTLPVTPIQTAFLIVPFADGYLNYTAMAFPTSGTSIKKRQNLHPSRFDIHNSSLKDSKDPPRISIVINMTSRQMSMSEGRVY